MKVCRFARFGPPAEVCRIEEVPDPPPPGPGEVRVETVAFPVNPVDLLTIEGRYATRPSLPATPGSEALARVVEVGAGVELERGELVLMMGRGNWVEAATVPASATVAVGAAAGERGVDPLQLAMLKINPPTALLMLTRYVDLAAGEWLIQNAANSAVGIHLIRLARRRGVRSVNVVRSREAGAAVEAAGGDVVLVDGEDLAARVAEATGDSAPRLAVDAVAGTATARLARCLAEGATLVSYGMLSGAPCAIEPFDVIFRRVTLTGFWLVDHLGRMERAELEALYGELVALLAAGELGVPIETTYRFEELPAALAHAARGGRAGKVLVAVGGRSALTGSTDRRGGAAQR